jgi:RimJ/RimL family protein N-acetyltransferase
VKAQLPIETNNLVLSVRSPDETKAAIEAMSPDLRSLVSPAWRARLANAHSADPWIHGFSLRLRSSGTLVGTAGFKSPPSEDGIVELAYAIEPEHQRKGYATEAAGALTAFALSCDQVTTVCAHTLPEPNASTRVLAKCGFQHAGEVIDPEDGRVWRWHIHR